MLTKLYVKEYYESHAASHGSLDIPGDRPPLRRDQCLVEDLQADSLPSYRAPRDQCLVEDLQADSLPSYLASRAQEAEDYVEDHQEDISETSFSALSLALLHGTGDGGDIGDVDDRGGDAQLKSYSDPLDHSCASSFSNAVDIPSPPPCEDGLYHPLSPFGASPFEMDLGGMGDTGPGILTPGSSQAETPSPLDHSKAFPPMRTRKSSSLSNVLDDTSYGTDPPTADTISNTSNPQVGPRWTAH